MRAQWPSEFSEHRQTDTYGRIFTAQILNECMCNTHSTKSSDHIYTEYKDVQYRVCTPPEQKHTLECNSAHPRPMFGSSSCLAGSSVHLVNTIWSMSGAHTSMMTPPISCHTLSHTHINNDTLSLTHTLVNDDTTYILSHSLSYTCNHDTTHILPHPCRKPL